MRDVVMLLCCCCCVETSGLAGASALKLAELPSRALLPTYLPATIARPLHRRTTKKTKSP